MSSISFSRPRPTVPRRLEPMVTGSAASPSRSADCVGKFHRSVSLLAWGYNEEALVERFLDRAIDLLDRTVEDWEVVFVDDGSTDRTSVIIDDYANREPRLRVVHNECNLNVGRSARRAIAHATKDYMI